MFGIDVANYTDRQHCVPMGAQYEDDVRYLKFDLNDFVTALGAGTFEWVNKRPNDDTPYVIDSGHMWSVTDTAGHLWACWTISATDTDQEGEGECELRYYPTTSTGSVSDVCKTVLFRTKVERSLGVPSDPSGARAVWNIGMETDGRLYQLIG